MAALTHIALWTTQLETLRDFYVRYFNGKSNEKYVNPKKGFSSYFVYFESGPALEIMQRTDVTEPREKEYIGLAHLAFHVRSKAEVDRQIELFRGEGYAIVGEPRTSGDGYYEGVILDPDGNRVELVAFGEPEIVPATCPPYTLLLDADPDQAKVDAYWKESESFVALWRGTCVGVIVVKPMVGGEAEIMNLAVDPIFRGRGIARRLLRHVSTQWTVAKEIHRLIIRTGTSSVVPLLLYQQEGFDLVSLERDYFTRHYAEPIWENGVQCRHQLVLEKCNYSPMAWT